MKAILYKDCSDCNASNSYIDSHIKADAVINDLTDVVNLVKRM